MRYITEQEVKDNLGMLETINILEEAFESLAAGTSHYRPRERIVFNGTVFNTMPGVFGKRHLAGLKTYIAGRNGARFAVLIFDTETNDLLSVIEANRLGQVRTGALPAMVTRRIVDGGTHGLAVIGSGFQAETQMEGINEVFDLEGISVYSRTFRHAQEFAARMSGKLGTDVKAFDSVKDALKNSTIINSITDSNDPIFSRKDLGDEYHVNLCGGNLPMRKEAGEDVLLDSELLVVEDVEQAMKESGEIIDIAERHPEKELINLGDLMKLDPKQYQGKRRTVFKTMGIGLEDVAAAYVLMKNMDLL